MDGGDRGATLFTNLIYDTDTVMDGPEFIVNPEALGDRIDALRGKTPDVLITHLLEVHQSTPHGQVIRKSQVGPGDMFSFTNLAAYHKTPDPESRGVDVSTLEAFLPGYFSEIGEEDWARSYGRCADLVAREGSSAGLHPDERKFMESVAEPVLLLARRIHLAKGAGQIKIYLAELEEAGVTRDHALRILHSLGANPRDVVLVPEDERYVEHLLTDPPRTLKRELSNTIRERDLGSQLAQPQPRCFAGVLVVCESLS